MMDFFSGKHMKQREITEHRKKQGGYGPAGNAAETTFEYYLGMDWPTVVANDSNGNETEFDALMTFESDTTGKAYVLYTDNSKDQEGNVQVYASYYDPEADKHELVQLFPITEDIDYEIVEAVLERVQKEVLENPEKFLDDLL